jgi:hypothetical protein
VHTVGTTACAVPCRFVFGEALEYQMICTFPYSRLLGTCMKGESSFPTYLLPPTNLHLSIHHTEYMYVPNIQEFSSNSQPNPVTLINQPRLALTA